MGSIRGTLWAGLIPAATLIACGGESEVGPPDTDGGGGAAPEACEVSDTVVDGVCIPAGVPEGSCGQGFSWADSSCDAILPEAPCPDGLMALTGETECRPVAPCGAAPWGDIPLEAGTLFVDAAAAPGGNGSQGAPYASLSDAVTAAPAGAQIAIAEGSYAVGMDLNKAVRIWGRCPELVELVSPPGGSAFIIYPPADGVELHTLGITGGSGLTMTGTIPATIDRLWIHDTGERGIGVEDTLAPAEVTITGTLVERAAGYGIYVSGAAVELVDSVVRDTQIVPAYDFGRGIYAIANASTGGRAVLTMRHSIIDRAREVGLAAGGADLVIEDSLIRDTLPDATGDLGRGMALQREPATQELTNTVIRRSVIELSREIGIFTGGGSLALEDSVVRDTLPSELDSSVGWGLSLQPTEQGLLPTEASLLRSTIERNEELAIGALGANVNMARTLVRETGPGVRGFGRGVHLQVDLDHGGVPSTGVVDHCAFLDGSDVGFVVNSATLQMNATLIARTAAAPKEFPIGDALAVYPLSGPASAVITGSEFRESARAGIGVFSSPLTVSDSRMLCNAFDLNSEAFEGLGPAEITDGGGNVCGCGDELRDCKALSAGLVPPSAL